MDYKRIYDSLIGRCRLRERVNGYTEKHHVIPKCLGGDDSADNIVEMTLREHYVAHKLLAAIYNGNKSLIYALWMMTTMTMKASSSGKCGSRVGTRKYVSSRDYENAKLLYVKSRVGKVYSDKERENVSNGTSNAMRSRLMIDKCISGSRGCRYYYDKESGDTFKWFEGDGNIDLGRYSWGRKYDTTMMHEKRESLKVLKKRYLIIPKLNTKYTLYEDYVDGSCLDWEERWTNDSNKSLKDLVYRAVREFDLRNDYKYHGEIVFTPNGKTRNFKIITPSLYLYCSDAIVNWRDEDLVDELVFEIERNIDKIIDWNKRYVKK